MELLPGLPDDLGLECLFRVPNGHFSSVSSVCKSWKVEIQQQEFWRQRKAAGFSKKLIVMAQAWVNPNKRSGSVKFTETPVYRLTLCEPETGYWRILPPLPGYPDGLPMFCQLIAVGLNLVVMGGWDPVTWEVSKAVFIYSFISSKWRRGADIPGARRSFFGCASDFRRVVFVAGGHDNEKNALSSAYAYDVEQDRWIQLPAMSGQRDECKGVFHRGKFHVIGGYPTNMQGRFSKSAETFNPATWQWDAAQEDFLESEICPRTCVDGGDSKIYMTRGAYVVAYVDDSSTWQVVAELPADVRTSHYLTAWQSKLFVIGSPRFTEPHRVYTLDLKSYTWTKMEAPENFSGHVQAGCCLEM